MQAENYLSEKLMLRGVPLVLTSYKIGMHYHCRIANEDPGAVIARSTAESQEEALRIVREKAEKRLGG